MGIFTALSIVNVISGETAGQIYLFLLLQILFGAKYKHMNVQVMKVLPHHNAVKCLRVQQVQEIVLLNYLTI